MGEEVKVFNTAFETSLRLLVLLEKSGSWTNFEHLLLYDFICSYANDFGISEYNLNGKNSYKYGEMSVRRANIKRALKILVLDGMADVQNHADTLYYKISDAGIVRCKALNSEYAEEYADMADKVISSLNGVDTTEIANLIKRKTFESIKRDKK